MTRGLLALGVLLLGACGGSGGSRDAGVDGGGGAAGGQAGAGGQGGGGACTIQNGSCANGESCCGGLTCCTGVPVQQGQEYCGTTCPVSDRNMKRDFTPIDRDTILEKLAQLPISSWSYKSEEPAARHIGPMAQDFMSTFHVGSSDKTILQVDADGVALAAIQALHAEVQRLGKQNETLARELSEVRSRIARQRRTGRSD